MREIDGNFKQNIEKYDESKWQIREVELRKEEEISKIKKECNSTIEECKLLATKEINNVQNINDELTKEINDLQKEIDRLKMHSEKQ